MDEGERDRLFRQWNKAVSKTLDWVDDDVEAAEESVEA